MCGSCHNDKVGRPVQSQLQAGKLSRFQYLSHGGALFRVRFDHSQLTHAKSFEVLKMTPADRPRADQECFHEPFPGRTEILAPELITPQKVDSGLYCPKC